MNKRMAFIFTAALVAVIWCGAAAFVAAESADKGAPSVVRPLAEPTIPPPETLALSLELGPQALCPGWNIYQTLHITNTSTIAPIAGLVITQSLPLGTWYGGEPLQGTLPGSYVAGQNMLRWSVDSLAPGQALNTSFLLHTYSSLPTGTIITNTFVYTSPSLSASGLISGTVIVDRSVCPKTPTPTATATPTRTAVPTATPTSIKPNSVALPLIRK